ncbi:hypothetical protein EN871_32185 [bacterium M00.F.Ca.ET.228.01.1.1]|nr:hypothetical protein EN871_32185 [bacterium M00.F.Ca.ET.228.01.1.1]TGR95272.1 hypothetical protein EN834_32170 [bacterium M00.F.Ca.ET.191.01.1.1]TGT96121.1 hypothetical protein EN798_32180 [bacterium M00.F.Ca.ET.155.01.1.1]
MSLPDHQLIGLIRPASAIFVKANYPAVAAAIDAVDISLLLDANSYLLGFVGTNGEESASGFAASPRFSTIEQLEAFCAEHASEYVDAGKLQHHRGACLSPAQWAECLHAQKAIMGDFSVEEV